MVSPGGAAVSATAARPNHVVPRKVFDARLVDAARAQGVEVRRHQVRDADPGRRHRSSSTGSGPGAVVAADGADSTVRRLLGVPMAAERHTAIAVRGYADLPPGSERADGAQFIAMQKQGWPAYAWSFPIGDGTANIGFGMMLPRLRATGRPGPGGAARSAGRAAAGPVRRGTCSPTTCRCPPAGRRRRAAAGCCWPATRPA